MAPSCLNLSLASNDSWERSVLHLYHKDSIPLAANKTTMSLTGLESEEGDEAYRHL